jgi:hypothetical protein
MLRNVMLVGLSALGLTGTLAAVAAGPFFAPEPPQTTGEPFSGVAQTQSTTVFADGNRIVRTNTVHYYRDGQGRTRVDRAVVDERANNSAQGGVVMIEDPVNGEHISLMPMAKMAAVFKYPNGHAPAHSRPASQLDTTAPFGLLGLGMGIGADGRTTESSADTTSLGQKVISGVMATGTRVVRVIPVGALGNEKPITSTLEEWKSAELGIPVQITEKSSIGGTLTYNLQDVVRAEPDPSLFTVPANYTRRDINAPSMTVAGTVTGSAVVTAVKKP